MTSLDMRAAMSENRHMTVILPELTHNDVVDIARVLSAISDAFIEHHQNQLSRQCRLDQPDLFEVLEEEELPF